MQKKIIWLENIIKRLGIPFQELYYLSNDNLNKLGHETYIKNDKYLKNKMLEFYHPL